MADPPIVLPDKITKNTVVAGKTFLAGAGPRHAEIMVITPVVTEEEAAEVQDLGYGRTKSRVPRMLDCPQGVILKDLAMREGIDLETCFVVPIVRYLPEKKYRLKPSTAMMNELMPLLEADIADVKPKIIICCGAQAFRQVVTLRTPEGRRFQASEADIMGNWFYEQRYNARIYEIPALNSTMNPEKHDRFLQDFREIRRMYDAIHGAKIDIVKTDYRVITNAQELTDFVLYLESINATRLAVDCEWHGNNHVDGELRTFQIAWDIGKGAAIKFRDETRKYVFDIDYKEAGDILSYWLDRPEVKYIGHHVSSDLPWMHKWLGLQWHEKAAFDTMFALQCCDESAAAGLDVLALKYTDLGKYDWDLIMWKKTHAKELSEGGYGYIPDNILLPYSIKDVDATFRSWKVLEKWLERQNLTTYYNELFNPLVTDVFTSFCLNGLPIDVEKMSEMRDVYNWGKQELSKDFIQSIEQEADELLHKRLVESLGEEEGSGLYEAFKIMVEDYRPDPMLVDQWEDIVINHRLPDNAKPADVLKIAKKSASYTDEEINVISTIIEYRKKSPVSTLISMIPADKIKALEPVIAHWAEAPAFNIRSQPHMRRWLFDVKRYTPIKSTANKDQGMPSIDWEKVMSYAPEKQATYTAAADKGTVAVLASRYSDPVLDKLLELNSCGTICKQFLKPSAIDPDTGKTIKEEGLHYYVTSKNTIALNHSTTDTGRSKSWKPNVLTWPSWVHAKLGSGMVRIIKKCKENGTLPKFMEKYVDTKAKNFPTIRSVMMARPGWCIVEADYKTAEMRGLAYVSGDEKLISLIEDPDKCFALPKPECVPDGVDPADCVVRIKYPDYVKYPEDKDKYLMTYTVNGEIKATFTKDQLQYDETGDYKSPGFDMH